MPISTIQYSHFLEPESLRRESAGNAAIDSRRPRPKSACGTRDIVTTECLQQSVLVQCRLSCCRTAIHSKG